MELRHLRYFVAVAEKLNFTEAARMVRIAQPSLSQQIQDLEKHLGVSLMDRNNRLVRLTPAGKMFLNDARRILQQAEEARIRAQQVNNGQVGECRVGFLFPAVRNGMAHVVSQFRKLYPEVRLHLAHYSPEDQVKMLDQGQLDLAFTRPYNERAYPHFIKTLLYQDTLVAVLPSDHPYAVQTSIDLAQLTNQPVVMFSRDVAPVFYDTIISYCGAYHSLPAIQHREPYLMDTIVMMVESGMGIGIVPGNIQTLRPTTCVFLPFSSPAPPIDLLMLQHKNSVDNPIVSSFAQLALSHCELFKP